MTRFGWLRDGWLMLILLLVIGAYQWRNRWDDFAFTSDAGAYLAGARSIAAGEGYRFSAHEGSPKISLYPPLQSVLLAPAFRWGPVFPGNVPLLHGIMIALSLLTLAVVFVFLRVEAVPQLPTALFVLLWGVSAQWMTWLGFMVADVGFAAVPAALALVWRADRAGPEWRRWLWLGLGMALAYWWRTAAQAGTLALGLIVLGRCVLGGDWRRAACFFGPVIFSYVGWRWARAGGLDYGRVLTGYFEYEGGWPGYLRTLASHGWILVRGFEFWPFLAAPIRRQQLLWQEARQWWLAVPLLGGMIVVHGWWAWRTVLGLVMSIDERDLAVVFALAIYGAQLFFVPFHGHDYHRYLYPFAPFFFLWFWRSRATAPVVGVRSGRRTCAVLALLIGLNVAGLSVVDQINRPRFSLAEVREMAEWFRENTPPEARVAMDWNLPVEHWRAWSGRPVLVNEAVRAALMSPIRRGQQPGPDAAYFVWSPYANSAEKTPPSGELIRKSASGGLQLYRYRRGPQP